MSRHLVCLTFDFDAMSGFVARGMRSPTPVSQGEFGNVAAKRLLALLDERGIEASWFIPGVVIGTYPETCEEIAAAGHEIGHHGWTHVPPASLGGREEEEAHLAKGIEAIERLTGVAPRGYRSPSWDLSEHTIDLLLAHGFFYESSMMGHDWLPYYARRGDRVPADAPVEFGETTALIEMPISWALDDFPHFEFVRSPVLTLPGLKAADGVLANWIGDFEYMIEHTDWGVLTYTCHPYVIGRGHRMRMLERLIDHIAEKGGVFTTMEAAAREFHGR